MEIKIIKEHAQIFYSYKKYIILNGCPCSGKFYASCQKAVINCMARRTRCAIYSESEEYARYILKEIIGDSKFNSRLLLFDNNSTIDIIGHRYVDDMPRYDMLIVRSADILTHDTIEKITRKTTGQIILTCNDYSSNSWLMNASNLDVCCMLHITRPLWFCPII